MLLLALLVLLFYPVFFLLLLPLRMVGGLLDLFADLLSSPSRLLHKA